MLVNNNMINLPDALPAGYRFSEYEIKDVIGGSDFGLVYRAWDHLLERTIAIKEYLPGSLVFRAENSTVLPRDAHDQPLFLAGKNSFIQEARLLARFTHPGLLHVLRFWEENGTAYMGTLFYSGVTLKTWLHNNNRPLIDERWIRQLLPPLFGAIGTLHRAGYLHGDISLDNIQIQENHLPVLLDPGLARKEIGNLSDQIDIMLKPGYAPIEQYGEQGDSEQGPWTDIYALGAVLHTLVTGEPPPASMVRCIEERYCSLVLQKPTGFSPALLAAIDRALMMKPHDRPQSIDDFAARVNLPVATAEELACTTAKSPEIKTVVKQGSDTPAQRIAATPASVDAPAATPMVSSHGVPKLLVLLTMVLVIIVLIVILNQHIAPVSALTASDAPQPLRRADVNIAAPIMATVYLKPDRGDTLLLDDTLLNVHPDNNGFVTLKLAAGHYTITVKSGNKVYSQQLDIAHSGTWLINPIH